MKPVSLDAQTYNQGLRELSAGDPDLARILGRLGPPPLWERPAGFPTLVYIILEQQVSLASARAAYTRLCAALELPFSPRRFLRHSDAELKQIGFSRQKTAYCRGLAQAILDGELDLDALAMLDDSAARQALVRLKGIGPWTADIYLLMALLRPDIWPTGDLALVSAIQRAKRLDQRPDPAQMHALAEPWKPWRAVAARLLWNDYLNPE